MLKWRFKAIAPNFKMDEKLFYGVLIGTFIIFGIFLVGAYNPGGQADPSVFGHSEEEVEGIQTLVNTTIKVSGVMNKVLKPGDPSEIITLTGGGPYYPSDAKEILVRAFVQNEFVDGSSLPLNPISLSISSDKLFLQVHNHVLGSFMNNGDYSTQEFFWFPVGGDRKVTFSASNGVDPGAQGSNGDNVRFIVQIYAYRS